MTDSYAFIRSMSLAALQDNDFSIFCKKAIEVIAESKQAGQTSPCESYNFVEIILDHL